MAARKLQTEIDRTFKKVAEGVELFEGLYDKLQSSPNPGHKEKLESDLKTQIKKLQRLRDQIKTWLQSSDIKDKKPLLDNRRLIETQMEKFKAAEKEMKTKAFSKEGLIAAAKLGPEEKAKLEMSNWLASMVDELSRQIEAAEAEIEQMMATSKKSKKSSSKEDRTSTLEHQNERRQWHISRLEILLRMLENGSLEVDQINDVKEDIAYFVESNIEEDFEEDEGIYDEFNLDEEEEAFGLRDAEEEKMESSPTPPPAPVSEEPVTKPAAKETKKDEVHVLKSKDEKEKKTKKATTTTAEPPLKERVVTNFEQGKLQSTSPVPPPAPKAPAPAATLPPIRYAAAAAAAVATSQAASAAAATGAPATTPAAVPEAAADTSATQTHGEAEGDASTPSAEANGAAPARGDARLPDTLSDLVTSFEWAKQKALLRDSNLSHVQRSLDASYASGAPEPVDSESPKHYVPKDPFPTPHYYPQSPASLFDNPALYAKFDVDTLFYIFYYQQGTYHQYLAARELKKQSWRFHKQYLTWFQRHSEPQAITDEYEQGAYVYFDWEGSWCQRRKNDFRFEYRWLEDN
ncbi:general negative regulator of transcription subunit 5 [Malassezia equina]|uniref:General negative regulator of transcription subunit n=1 Tax=Malassezia equina TaxID=1381935 RepID=A0AAF0J1F5_9BASI|nr:general negative regulator of transcription subunit 5 [Malassezia equina]